MNYAIHVLEDKIKEINKPSEDEDDECLYADPNQIKTYHKPITLNILQNDRTYAKSTFTVEDDSTTRWLNKNGELVRIGEVKNMF